MIVLLAALVALSLVGVTGVEAQAPETSCVTCHGDSDLFGPDGATLIGHFEQDAHRTAGLSCHDCHGGNPDPKLAEDIEAAMSASHADNPYRGVPDHKDVPAFCGGCHSDITYMHRFNPRAVVDQEREYWTSQHGKALAAGDTAVATCVDCHGAHGILGSEEPASSIHSKRLAETCGGCHSDPERMAGRERLDGSPLPIDQYARWSESVHAEALLEREDLSAPTCNDCHGNHGANPPGLQSISFVCGQCHGREAEVFRASGKWEAFEVHNEFLPDAGEEGCAACHDALPEAAHETARFTECSSCHDHHSVVRPTIAMLAPLPETPCDMCHGLGPDEVSHEREDARQRQQELQSLLVAASRDAGLTGDALFDQLVDDALAVPQHTIAGAEASSLKPEFERLFLKYRIGKTYFTHLDPASGETVRRKITRCDSCHTEGSTGLEVAGQLMDQMRELTRRGARAERILLAARRGGVETGKAALAIDHTVDAQIDLQVLLHGFSAEEGTAFAAARTEGLEHARVALDSGEEALGELRFRRVGLGVTLFFVMLVAVGLALKIRELPP